MQDRLSRIDADLAAIGHTLAALERRIAALETGGAPAEDGRLTDRTPPAAPHAGAGPGLTSTSAIPLLALAGRTCLVLGGAYLLRALTETGRLPAATGVSAALLYAVVWFAAADRASPTRLASGAFHGATAVLIGFPLVWEASTRFELLGPIGAAATLGALLAVALLVAWRRRLATLAGLATTAGVVVALALAVTSAHILPFAIGALALGLATSWLADVCGWPWLRGIAAVGSLLLVAALGARAAVVPPTDAPAGALAVAVALPLSAMASAAWWSRRRRATSVFDAAFTALALAAGLGAAFAIARRVGAAAPAGLAAGTLATAALAYAASFRLIRGRHAPAGAAYYASSIGAVGTLVGVGAITSGFWRDGTFAGLAVLAAWLGARRVHPVFAVHSAALAVASAASAGVLACAAALWIGIPAAWPAVPPAAWIVVAAALPGGLIPRQAASKTLEVVASMSRLLLAVVLVASLGSVVVLLIGPIVAGSPPDPGRLACLETGILAAAAVLLALVARWPFGGELGWLAYPVLAAGGVKLVAEDFRVSTPSTLFASLAIFGLALILTARIRSS